MTPAPGPGGPGGSGRAGLAAAIRAAGRRLARRGGRRSSVSLAPRAEWTWRRIPNAVARGLLAACVAAVGLLLAHVDGWGWLGRVDARVVGATYLVGLPVALLFAFFLVAPLLRRVAGRRVLRPGRVAALGALAYGGLVFAWMLAIPVGPPPALAERIAPEGAPAPALVALYRHALTPLAFALYGAVAAGCGWLAAFGPVPARDLRALVRAAPA